LDYEVSTNPEGIGTGVRTKDTVVSDLPVRVSERMGRRAHLQEVQIDGSMAQWDLSDVPARGATSRCRSPEGALILIEW
jgi:hypothetical protein